MGGGGCRGPQPKAALPQQSLRGTNPAAPSPRLDQGGVLAGALDRREGRRQLGGHRPPGVGGRVEGLADLLGRHKLEGGGVARPVAPLVCGRGGTQGKSLQRVRSHPGTPCFGPARAQASFRGSQACHPGHPCLPDRVGTSCRNSAMPLRSGQAKPRPSKKGSTSSRGPWKMILPDDSTCGRAGRVRAGWVRGSAAGRAPLGSQHDQRIGLAL